MPAFRNKILQSLSFFDFMAVDMLVLSLDVNDKNCESLDDLKHELYLMSKKGLIEFKIVEDRLLFKKVYPKQRFKVRLLNQTKLITKKSFFIK